MADSLTGRLLVASPALQDPNFARTVIFVCSHDVDGAFGLVLNRPLEVAVAAAVPEWPIPLAPLPVVFLGGPVDSAMLFALGQGERAATEAWSLSALPGLGVLDLTRIEEATALGVERSRVFAGYAGWGAGQLEAELMEEAWFVVDATTDDVFTVAPERVWHAALGRGVGPLAMYAFFPDDPAVN